MTAAAAAHLTCNRYPKACATATEFTVTINGVPARALRTSAGCFVQWQLAGSTEVVVATTRPLESGTLRPLRWRIPVRATAGALHLRLDQVGHYCLEIDGLPALYLFAEAPETEKPDPHDPQVRYFAGGQVYEVGALTLRSGETLYVEGGAVLRGAIQIANAQRVRVAGRGIIDNSFFPRGGPDGTYRPLMAEFCSEVTIEGLIFIEPATWTIEVAACRQVGIHGIRILGSLIAADGIDVVGCTQVHIADCFIRAGDDCIAVKAVEYGNHGPNNPAYCRDVREVVAERCVLHSYGGGSALEIGHELRCAEIAQVTFRDIDILAVHEWGAAIAIHNCDHALVRDVLYEDIRIEHYWVWLIDMRIIRSTYSVTPGRGRIRGVTFRRVMIETSRFNAGVSTSHLGGYDADHAIADVRFEGCVYGGVPVSSLDVIDGYAKHITGLVFQP